MRATSLPIDPAMCGVSTALGRSHNGEVGGNGSGSGVSMKHDRRPDAHSASSAAVSTIDPRAVLISQAPSRISANRSASIRCRVAGSSGACTVTMSAQAHISSSPIRVAPRAAASSTSTNGSWSPTSTSRLRSRSSTMRPILEAPNTPTFMP